MGLLRYYARKKGWYDADSLAELLEDPVAVVVFFILGWFTLTVLAFPLYLIISGIV